MRAGRWGDEGRLGVREGGRCDCCCAYVSADRTVGRSVGEGKGGKRYVDGGCGTVRESSCNMGVAGGVGCGVGFTTTTRGHGGSEVAVGS